MKNPVSVSEVLAMFSINLSNNLFDTEINNILKRDHLINETMN